MLLALQDFINKGKLHVLSVKRVSLTLNFTRRKWIVKWLITRCQGNIKIKKCSFFVTIACKGVWLNFISLEVNARIAVAIILIGLMIRLRLKSF